MTNHFRPNPDFLRISFLSLFAMLSVILYPYDLDAYELMRSSWPNAYTTFHVDIPGEDGLWDTAFEEAMEKWTSATDFTFYIEYDYADPCQDPNDALPKNGVKFSYSVCGDQWGRDTLAITISWTRNHDFVQSGTIFNRNEDWDVYSGPLEKPGYNGVTDFRRVAVHELGHTIGLDHEDDIASIMNSYVGDYEDPQLDDIAGVNILYLSSSSITAEPTCAGRKIMAASKCFKSLSRCYSRQIVRPDDIKFSKCSDKAYVKLESSWDKNETRAEHKGYDCTTATASAVYGLIETFFDSVDSQIRGGLDLNNRQAAKLGKTLLKAVAKYCAGLLSAEGANLKKPNQKKRGNDIYRANDRFVASWNKSISRARDKDIIYAGPALSDIEGLITALVADVLTEMQ